MTSFSSTNHINLNYLPLMQVIILIEFLVCNFTGNDLRNPCLSRRSTGFTCLCLNRAVHHKTDEKIPSQKMNGTFLLNNDN